MINVFGDEASAEGAASAIRKILKQAGTSDAKEEDPVVDEETKVVEGERLHLIFSSVHYF